MKEEDQTCITESFDSQWSGPALLVRNTCGQMASVLGKKTLKSSELLAFSWSCNTEVPISG